MKDSNVMAPAEIAEFTVGVGIKKTSQSAIKLLILGIIAGAFIAFAAEGSNMGAYNLFAKPETYGLGKALAGAIFGTGLMMVVIAGAELFTGNSLIIIGVLEKKVTLTSMLRNWLFVYIGNLIGSILIAFMMSRSGLFGSSAGLLGAMTIKIASGKVSLTFMQAVILGIMCNWLVCIAVWMSFGAKDMTGKLLAVFFPIMLFVSSGFEHSVANMYYIPAGIFAKNIPQLAEAAAKIGVTPEKLSHLNWSTFFINNLLPVTIGNIIGGVVFVGTAYWFIYLRKEN